MQAPLEVISPVPYNTVVIGAGPIGLLSALCALEYCPKKEKIALVADRIEELGLRQQILWVEEEVFDFIIKIVGAELVESYIESMAITQNLAKTGYYITTGDLERLFYDALRDQYEQGVNYDLIRSEKIASGKSSADHIKIDRENSTISVLALACNEKPYKGKGDPAAVLLAFKYLVTADGAKRSVVKTLAEEVIFDRTQSSLFHTKHAVVTFQLPEGTTPHDCYKHRVRPDDKDALERAHTLSPCPLPYLQDKFGWKGSSRPYSQVFATSDIIYIGTELPTSLVDRGEIQDFALTMMRDLLPEGYVKGVRELPCDVSTSWGKKKKQLSTSVFDIELGEINQTLMVCGNLNSEATTSVIFFLGDARKNPLYTTGSGVQTGIREALFFHGFLASQEALATKLVSFHAQARTVLDGIGSKQDKWVDDRNEKERVAMKNYYLFQKIKHSTIDLDDFINELAKLLDKEGVEESTPLFLQELHDKLEQFRQKHRKLFDCCRKEKQIHSYNDIDPKSMVEDLKLMRQDLTAAYSKVSVTSHAHDLYANFRDISKKMIRVDVEKAATAFFGSKKEQVSGSEINLIPKAL